MEVDSANDHGVPRVRGRPDVDRAIGGACGGSLVIPEARGIVLVMNPSLHVDEPGMRRGLHPSSQEPRYLKF